MKVEVGKFYEAQEEKAGIATGDFVFVQSVAKGYVSFRKSGDPVHFRWALEVFENVFYPLEETDGVKLEEGKKYKVLKSYGGHAEGDVLQITYIDIADDKVDFVVNDSNSDFDSFKALRKMALQQVKDVDKPAHYDTPIDTIDFMKANFSREAVEGFMRGNAIKYLQRIGKGEKLSDLKKAEAYIKMLIELEEEK